MIAPLKKRHLHWPEPMVPLWIAEGVCAEAARFLDEALPGRYPLWLATKAERCFQRNTHFRASMRERGNGGRDNLRMFMRHWLAALLNTERPDLGRALPPSFDLGRAPPPGKQTRINRRNRLPLPAPMAWDPDRVTSRRPWLFLAAATEPDRVAREIHYPQIPVFRTRRKTPTRLPRPGVQHAVLAEFPIR